MDNSVIISITMALYTRGLLHASVPVIYTYQTIHYASTHTDSVYIVGALHQFDILVAWEHES